MLLKQVQVVLGLICVWLTKTSSALQREQCNVCFSVIDQFKEYIKQKNTEKTSVADLMKEFCVGKVGKDHDFCYHVGAHPESASSSLSELERLVKSFYPTDKCCEHLSRLDERLCALRYEEQIDWKTVNLKKMKMHGLKKILSDWNEECKGCIEKSEYLKKIEELKPKYVRDEL